MDIGKIFETATRNKYRFPYKGSVSTEDLWDLSVNDLDTVFKSLNAQAKQSSEESLLKTKTSEDTKLNNKIELVRYIVGVKLEEADTAKKAKERRAQKQKLMGILSEKQDNELHNKSIEELQAMINALDE